MAYRDSLPSDDHPRRGMRAAAVVDSPMFKLVWAGVTILLTSIVIPLAAWGMQTVIRKLDVIEASITQSRVNEAVNEMRRQSLERDRDRHNNEIRALQDKAAAHDYDLRGIRERLGEPAHNTPRPR